MIISTPDKLSVFPPFICPEPSERVLRLLRQVAHTCRVVHNDNIEQTLCLN